MLIFAIFANDINLSPTPEGDMMYAIIDKTVAALQGVGIENIVILDNAFRKYSGREVRLWVAPADPHFSPLAHSLAAKEIAEYIMQKNIIAKALSDND